MSGFSIPMPKPFAICRRNFFFLVGLAVFARSQLTSSVGANWPQSQDFRARLGSSLLPLSFSVLLTSFISDSLSFQVGVVMLSILCHVWKVVPDLYEAIINMNRDNECGHEEEVICNIISSTCAQQRTGECHQVQGSAEKWLIGCVKRAPSGRGNHAT